jgi:type I restriction enzyme R subunit
MDALEYKEYIIAMLFLKRVNDRFGNIEWEDGDKVRSIITEELPLKVAAGKSYQNAIKQDDRQNTRIEHNKALEIVIVEMLTGQTEPFKQFMDNQGFRKWSTYQFLCMTN